nr:EOG090X027U [Macrothrix elegans]
MIQQPPTAQAVVQHSFPPSNDERNSAPGNSITSQTRQQSIEHSYPASQPQSNFPQHTRLAVRPPSGNVQPQQVLVRMQMVQQRQHHLQNQHHSSSQPPHSETSTNVVPASGACSTSATANPQQVMIPQHVNLIPSNLQTYAGNVRPQVRPLVPSQSVTLNQSTTNTVQPAVTQQQQKPSPHLQQQLVANQQGQPVQQVRPLTWQQQQILQMHIQNMTPQARQQLQQLTPQMRYAVLQRILQQQEANMQSQQQNQGQPQSEQTALSPAQLATQQPFQGTWQGSPTTPPRTSQQNTRPQLTIISGITGQNPQGAGCQTSPLQQVANPISNQALTSSATEQSSTSVNPKTKTALANLLSTRLQTVPSGPSQQTGATQLTGLVQSGITLQPGSSHPSISQQSLNPQQQLIVQSPQNQHLQQQRRSLQNITNGTSTSVSSVTTTSPSTVTNQSNAKHAISMPFSGVRMPGPGSMQPVIPGPPGVRREYSAQTQNQQQQQQQLFGHEPGVKVPEHLCLLGCIVLIVDYQRSVSQSELTQWTKLMCSRGAEVETVYSIRITHLLCETSRSTIAQQALRDGKRLVTAFWLNDIVLKQYLSPPSQVLHFPTPYGEADRPCRNMLCSISGFEGEDRLRVRFLCEAIGLKYTGHFSSQHDVLVCRKSEGPKFQRAREWRKPVVTTAWLAQVYFGFLSAIHQIHHPKYQQFNQSIYQQDPLKFEISMAGNFLAAWRIPIKITSEALEKFNRLPAQLRLKRNSNVQLTTNNDGGSPSKKKMKTEEEDKEKQEKSSSSVDAILEDVIKGGIQEKGKNCVMIRCSGFDATEISKMVSKLGGSIASNNREVTHLVMLTLKRTPKLLCCLPSVKFIVSPRWLEESAKHGSFLDEQPYLLKDTELEQTMNINILKILGMPDREHLFRGKTFYITPSVVPSRAVLREIVENSGGKVFTQPISIKSISELKQREDSTFVIISCPNDFHLLTEMIKQKTGVYSTEYILSAVLKQSFEDARYRIEV